jgi:hypothetical protein
MFTHGASQGLHLVQILTILGACIAMIFWRLVLKLILMVTVIIAVVLLTSGWIALLQEIHR